jgi:hypothetical protein
VTSSNEKILKILLAFSKVFFITGTIIPLMSSYRGNAPQFSIGALAAAYLLVGTAFSPPRPLAISFTILAIIRALL